MADMTSQEQAKELLRTIRVLQNKLIKRHFPRCHAREMDGEIPELTLAQMNTIGVVRDSGQLTVKELAQAMHVSAPSASAMVDRLVEMDALTREQSRVDRREVVIQVSDRGMLAIEAGAIKNVECCIGRR